MFSLPSFSQTDTAYKGIQWTEGLSWEKVRQKAKAENKYIFLDCFATWCGPCKAMDKKIFTSDTVGQHMNQKFISLKVQMDKTEHDNEQVKKWYYDVSTIQKNYTITAFPCFLFFSPEGKPIHKAVGYKNVSEFISLANNALNPQKQYYSLLNDYKPGKLDTSELKGLALAFRSLDVEMASKIAAEYFQRIPNSEWRIEDNLRFMMVFPENPLMQNIASEYLKRIPPAEFSTDDHLDLINYFQKVTEIKMLVLDYLEQLPLHDLGKNLSLLRIFKKEDKAKQIAFKYIKSLPDNQLYTKDNIKMLNSFTGSSRDRGFDIFFNHATEVNHVMGSSDYSQSKVQGILIEEKYGHHLQKATAQNADVIPWKNILKEITKKYNKTIAQDLNIWVKAQLYEYFATKKNKYWPEYIHNYIKRIERFGTDTTNGFQDALMLNNFVFSAIFFHSNKKKQINIGLKWMEGVIRRNRTDANYIDTYANLLYKSGRKDEAIKWQERGVQIAIEQRDFDWLLKSLNFNLDKMKMGQPTWVLPDSCNSQKKIPH